MSTNAWRGRALAAALLTGSLMGCQFIEPITSNPNAVGTATVDQLFVAIQLSQYRWDEGQNSRLASIWIQQMAGTDRQFQTLDEYIFSESEGDEYPNAYTGGGLVDIRRAIKEAEDGGRQVYAGILKVYEAYRIGMLASVFGDVSYSEAVNPNITTPHLDGQAAVYTAVQAKLDEAITDLQSGAGAGPGSFDLAFGGNATRWIAVAHTLKARFYMHWAEVSAANYASALAQAQQGITSSSGDWVAKHSDAATEANLWYQFTQVDRTGYISSGEYLVSQLVARSDPRLPLYFTEASGAYAGEYVGSSAGTRNLKDGRPDPGQSASQINPDGAGAASYAFPFVTCAENYFIQAEALYQTGPVTNLVAAHTALDNALACEGQRKGVSMAAAQSFNDALTGSALFDEIMLQNYMASFLNIEAWNDYKRTCRPAITTYAGQPVPARLLYSAAERQTNPNVPAPNAQPARNANDPNACP